jgi:calcineurin-like phosphoesterase family protein
MSIHEKWFISDTHFFHENIIQFCGRPFANAELMNEALVANWNSVVGPNDYVYHLGDVACGYSSFTNRELSELLHSLNGRKRLIVGNHDPIKSTVIQNCFEKIELWKGFKEHNFTASHMPLREGGFRDGAFNVHGHIHNNVIDDPKYINVSVEQINYKPIHIDEIGALIAKAS